jgi:signal transduction histidine kinase
MIGRIVGDAVRVDLQLAADAGRVMVDPRCLQAALLELATNARDAMPSGGRLTVRSAPAAGGLAMVEIADTGAGMPAERLASAFEPVFGSGAAPRLSLGLHIVERCVGGSGGRVEIASHPASGTAVRIYLPSP